MKEIVFEPGLGGLFHRFGRTGNDGSSNPPWQRDKGESRNTNHACSCCLSSMGHSHLILVILGRLQDFLPCLPAYTVSPFPLPSSREKGEAGGTLIQDIYTNPSALQTVHSSSVRVENITSGRISPWQQPGLPPPPSPPGLRQKV